MKWHQPKIIVSAALLFQLSAKAQTEKGLEVDHRYTPAWWQTLICMPDDPVKTLVGKEGQIFGDYGYKGGPRNFSFSIRFDGADPAVFKSQSLESARVPVVHTTKMANGFLINEDAFLQIPPEDGPSAIVRFDGDKVLTGWSQPKVSCDSAFRDAAEGPNSISGEGILEFHIRVAPGASTTVALGFCEGFWKEPGKRVMRVHAEGAAFKDIDPVRDFGANTPGVYLFHAMDTDKDGQLVIAVTNAPGAKDRNVIMNGIWLFDGAAPSAGDIVSGKYNSAAYLYAPCAAVRMPERRYDLLVTIKNSGKERKEFRPVIRYEGIESPEQKDGYIGIGNTTLLATSAGIQGIRKDTGHRSVISLPSFYLDAGKEKKIAVVIDRFHAGSWHLVADVGNATAAMQGVVDWWRKNCPSADAVHVPDAGIQRMAESCVRNIFQARDIREGRPSFHVGPTIYRGLWIADGSFILETVTMLNHIMAARSCIDYLSGYQLPGGGFQMMTGFHKENGLVIYMLARHAQLTQDKRWLSDKWSIIEGCIGRIQHLRKEALKDPHTAYYGLLPPGFVDGGIRTGEDYSNTEWCLSGMKWAIRAAKWLGKTEEAGLWQKEYDDFYKSFMASATSDLRKDDKGNTYLPVMIHNQYNYPPVKGQWAFCQSVYPGQLFDDDPAAEKIARGTVDMLHDHRKEGLVLNTGWMTGGIWNYFASFYGHDLLWLGEGEQTPQLLYDYANHSSPTLDWREEQKPQGKGDDEVGDMPHNWASAEFVRLLIHMIELDRGNELHLFEGLPSKWLVKRDSVALNGIRTPFGRINLSLKLKDKGNAARLHLEFMDHTALPAKIVVHRAAWAGINDTMAVPVSRMVDIDIAVR